MTRDIDAATLSASQSAAIHPVLFVELLFDGGAVRFHSELGEIVTGGNTYTGTGRLGSVSPVQEDTELARSTLSLSLSGLPTDIVAAVLNESFQGRRATLSLGYFDTANQLVADPVVLYRGRMDTVSIEQGQDLTVTISVESRFAAWDRPLERRYNDADQQARYPGDLGMQFVEQAVNKELFWGITAS